MSASDDKITSIQQNITDNHQTIIRLQQEVQGLIQQNIVLEESLQKLKFEYASSTLKNLQDNRDLPQIRQFFQKLLGGNECIEDQWYVYGYLNQEPKQVFFRMSPNGDIYRPTGRAVICNAYRVKLNKFKALFPSKRFFYP
jgi:hypothetical protein